MVLIAGNPVFEPFAADTDETVDETKVISFASW